MAQTVTLNFIPTADAFVSASNADDNYGGAGALAVAGAGSSAGIFDTVMKFDLSSIAGYTVQSATLELSAPSLVENPIFGTQEAGNFTVTWMQNSSWVEGTGMPRTPTMDGITYDSLPDYLTANDEDFGSFAYPGDMGAMNSYTLQLTPDFVSAVTSGTVVSFELTPADDDIDYVFNSKDYVNPADYPVLVVVAEVPEPGVGWCFLAGLMVIAAGRRCRAWRDRV